MNLPLLGTDRFDTFGDQLVDIEHEREFRDNHLNGDIRQATIYMAITTTPIIVGLLIRSTQYLTGNAQEAFALSNLIINLIALATILVFIALIRIYRTKKIFEAVLFIYMTALGGLLVLNQYLRPPDYVGTVYLLLILHNMFLMPVPLRIQLIPTLAFCGSIIWLILRYREPTYLGESINSILAILTCLAGGIVASRMLGQYRRSSYLHFTRERKTRNQLEESLATIKHLSGIVPICASCHKIRDDEDDWHRVEVYLERHSEAEMSHSICPECVRNLYADTV